MKFLKWLREIFTPIRYKTDEETHKEKLDMIATKLAFEVYELTNLLPKKFRKRFKEEFYIAGGCIYSLYNETTPKDYDFFVRSESFAEELREYFIDVSDYKGSDLSGGMYKNHQLVISDNAISIGRFQVITRWVGEPVEVLSQFDFAHNQCYWEGDEVKTLSDFKYLQGNELIYNEKRARDIVGTIIRVPRFVQRGMKIKSKEMAKILLRLHEVGFNERELEILKDTRTDKHFGS